MESVLSATGSSILERLLARPPQAFLRAGAIPVFAPRREEDRAADAYDRDSVVADYYSAVAFGHMPGVWDLADAKSGRGAAEGLYRTVASAVLELGCRHPSGVVLDAGCGVARTVCDCAPAMQGWSFIAMDFAYRMCERAHDVVAGGPAMALPSLARRGFLTATLPARAPLTNACVVQGSVLDLPFHDGAVDAVTATLLIDRLADPARGLKEMARVLAYGGRLVLSTPLNFRDPVDWMARGDAAELVKEVERSGFVVESAFDGLRYTEIKDRRGSSEEWQVAVVVARRLKST